MSNKIPNTNRFSVPKGYFNSFKERIDIEVKLDQLLEGSKETGFKVPENYFLKNPERYTPPITKPVKVISLFNNKWIWAATSVAAIVLLIVMIMPIGGGLDPIVITDAEMENYLLDESAYDIAELLEDEELEDLSTELFDDDMYIDYLNNTTDAYDFYLE